MVCLCSWTYNWSFSCNSFHSTYDGVAIKIMLIRQLFTINLGILSLCLTTVGITMIALSLLGDI